MKAENNTGTKGNDCTMKDCSECVLKMAGQEHNALIQPNNSSTKTKDREKPLKFDGSWLLNGSKRFK